MRRDWKLRIEDILDAIARIERFTAAVDAPVIWQAAAENAPRLKPMMEKILAQEPDEGP